MPNGSFLGLQDQSCLNFMKDDESSKSRPTEFWFPVPIINFDVLKE